MRFFILLLLFLNGCVSNNQYWTEERIKEAIEMKSEGEHDFRWGTCMKCGYVIEGFHWENIPKVCIEKEWVN